MNLGKAGWTPTVFYIAYDDLRNNRRITYDYLKEKLDFMESHCDELVSMLMELKELE